MIRKIRILAMDREDIILSSVRKALRKINDIEYIVTTCNAALDGLKLVRNNAFDIVLIDLILPGMNGIEVLRRVKNISPNLPVVIMSGYRPEKISTDETLKKAEGYLLKPFTVEELRSLILQITEQSVNI